jgi:hypothetical protein
MGLIADRRDGIATVAGDYVLGAGWGASTFTVTAGSSDHSGEIVITGVTGGGLAQATATVAFTFKNGAMKSAPAYLINSTDDSSIIESGNWAQSNTTTVGTWTYSVLPVNAKIYKVHYILLCPF